MNFEESDNIIEDGCFVSIAQGRVLGKVKS
jgi:hypothetical protein